MTVSSFAFFEGKRLPISNLKRSAFVCAEHVEMHIVGKKMSRSDPVARFLFLPPKPDAFDGLERCRYGYRS